MIANLLLGLGLDSSGAPISNIYTAQNMETYFKDGIKTNTEDPDVSTFQAQLQSDAIKETDHLKQRVLMLL